MKFVVKHQSLLLSIVISLALLGWVFSGDPFHVNAEEAPTKLTRAADQQQLQSVRIRLAKASLYPLRIRVSAVSEPSRRIELRAQTHGRVTERLAQAGQSVTAGEPILRIDPADRLSRRTAANALVKQRQIELTTVKNLFARDFATTNRMAEAETALETAQAQLKQITIDLEYTEIRAPSAGILDQINSEPGEVISAGQLIGRLVTLDPLQFIGQISEQDVAFLRPGDPVTITPLSGKQFSGTVHFISREADSYTRTFRIEVRSQNAESILSGGLSVYLDIESRPVLAHQIEPSMLMIDRQGRLGIHSLDDDDRVRFLSARILVSNTNETWLVDLPEKVRIITVGQGFVNEGDSVIPVLDSTP